jgi:hypothetical protein
MWGCLKDKITWWESVSAKIDVNAYQISHDTRIKHGDNGNFDFCI